MRHRSVLAGVASFLVAASLHVAAGAQETAKTPKAVVPEAVVDLGEVTYGASKNHDFVVRNTGSAPLRIHAVNSNCVCAVVDFPEEIAPGAEGKIAVRFDAELQGGPAAVSLTAITNDPAGPQIQLTLKANVKYFINATPGVVRYLVVQHFDADSTVTQTLWSTDGTPMRVTGVETPYDFITATFREAKAEEVPSDAPIKQQWKVETQISPSAPIGPLAGDLVIHVDHPQQKVVKMPLHGFVRPMFAVTPPVAEWPPFAIADKAYRTSLHVKNFAEETVKITGAETTVPGISAEVVESQPGREYYVRLLYPPELPKGDFSGVVRIRTESTKQPLIEVPLKGTVE